MKRVIYFLILLSLVGFALTYLYQQGKTITVSVPALETIETPVATLPERQVKTVAFNNDTYAYAYISVPPATSVSLIPNFTDFKDAETLMSEHNCTSVINGGFYDKSNKPLGYFQSGDSILSRELDSALFNGFIWQNASDSAVISSTLPRTHFRFALQTGPMLMFDGNVLSLSINNDTSARRMLAAKNKDNQLIFLTVYNEDSVFDGPLLEELPDIVRAISNKETLFITDAINLDGGSASTFYDKDTSLAELTHAGSLFCVK